MTGQFLLLAMLVIVTVVLILQWIAFERRRKPTTSRAPRAADVLIGFVTDFFDTLGIGNFAPTTAAFKLLRRVADENIPGTLNVGHAVPVLLESLISPHWHSRWAACQAC